MQISLQNSNSIQIDARGFAVYTTNETAKRSTFGFKSMRLQMKLQMKPQFDPTSKVSVINLPPRVSPRYVKVNLYLWGCTVYCWLNPPLVQYHRFLANPPDRKTAPLRPAQQVTPPWSDFWALPPPTSQENEFSLWSHESSKLPVMKKKKSQTLAVMRQTSWNFTQKYFRIKSGNSKEPTESYAISC